jgi:hypothetical protein
LFKEIVIPLPPKKTKKQNRKQNPPKHPVVLYIIIANLSLSFPIN